MIFRKRGRYDGPVLFIPFDHDGPDGRHLKGGWHYSTKVHRKYGEIAVHPLHLEDKDDEPYYEYAEKNHKSWVEKYGHGTTFRIGS